jgi:hypothetical protein
MKFVVRKTEVVASYIVIDGAKNHEDAENIFNSILENEEPIEFKDDEVLTCEYEVLSDYESERNMNYLGEK